jgi:hypothetical protein
MIAKRPPLQNLTSDDLPRNRGTALSAFECFYFSRAAELRHRTRLQPGFAKDGACHLFTISFNRVSTATLTAEIVRDICIA